MNQTIFAEMVGATQPTVSRWEKGAEPEIPQWEALKALGDRYNYVAFDPGRALTVPLVGYVNAGATVSMFAVGQGPFEEVEAPPGGTEHTVAVEVRGDSMAGMAEDRWIIYYNDRQEAPHEELYGKLCVIGLTDDRVLVKKLHPGRKPGRFDLYSTNGTPLLDQHVSWAAKVEWIKPR
ncbi:MAG TPA: S24 family peptidase [Magnetospirillum sp.]|nr:S24 family peptidase [Magnetospirillum sp.]